VSQDLQLRASGAHLSMQAGQSHDPGATTGLCIPEPAQLNTKAGAAGGAAVGAEVIVVAVEVVMEVEATGC